MGRKSSLTDKQWAEIGERLVKGEAGRVLAREYGISEAAIRKRAKQEGWDQLAVSADSKASRWARSIRWRLPASCMSFSLIQVCSGFTKLGWQSISPPDLVNISALHRLRSESQSVTSWVACVLKSGRFT
jgi:hypothetical protein